MKDLKFKNKIIVFNKEPAFGQGVARIMNLVRETKSLSKAYKIMDLSSSKGWKIIKRAEEDLGFELFNTVIGGKDGGNSELSQEGKDILNRYNAFVDEVDRESERLFKKYFSD
nr:molybdenum-binding protein [Tissierella sp.]